MGPPANRACLQTDKFSLVSDVWNKFVQNSIACYKPGANITVNEQLFPTKAWCWFTQYVSSKPDKSGIKSWLAADVDSKYMLNGFPYLGKDESRPPGQRLGENVVMRLMEPFLGKGRNVTMDNFFTSVSLAKKLVSNSMVGIINKNRRELPPSAQQQGELFTTSVLKHERVILTVYRCKPRKNICLLSTLHPTVAINNDAKRKPETVTYYNATKVGVEILDQMARLYSVKGGTCR
ncbi:uncharacterized protein LOC118232545 [Anguilla anguilla]|uniref:uncharacterized protein LOC118232545 n=1 Tax=Anguilla anguilla TaxID=7936 RepID=UPI0015A77E17|nr:uncharacterized protein LOC118232545 [Anguilla anguilla]